MITMTLLLQHSKGVDEAARMDGASPCCKRYFVKGIMLAQYGLQVGKLPRVHIGYSSATFRSVGS